MSSVDTDIVAENDNAKYLEVLKTQLVQGDNARHFRSSDGYQWFNNFVLKPLEDEAMETLKKAKTDEERVKAQQMLLAADKPRQILDHLVKQGEAAQLQLLSTHQNGG